MASLNSFHSRLPEVGTSIFSIMSKFAQEQGAINLSQGFPDFKVSEKLIGLINHYMEEGNNQYAPMPGVANLRTVISEVIQTTYQHKTNPETDITITAGGTEALFSVIAALVEAGDEVIIFDPAYDSYAPAVRLNGGVPIHINLLPPTFSIDWDFVRTKITDKTKLIMVNTPHNPCGMVLSDGDMRVLEAIALQHGIIVLSDEVYERIIFDGKVHNSILKYPKLAAQSVAVFSFGKTFHATGWKVGYAVAPEFLTKEIRKAHQFITFSVNTPVQLALAEFMLDKENYSHLGSFYQQKRDFFLENIKGSSFEPLPCFGSYFQLLSYKAVSSKPDIEMAEWLTKEYKLASIPISVFYNDRTDNHLLRFCFAKNEMTLFKAAEILKRI